MGSILTGPIVANLVVMSRAVEKEKSALLIEGLKDARIYRAVTDPNACRVIAAGSRANAQEALTILKAKGEPGVLAVVDADTDHLAGRPSFDPDLLLTHTRDAEGLILEARTLRKVLIEFDLPPDCFGGDPDMAAANAAMPLGATRFLAERRNWQVRFHQVDFARFVDKATLNCNLTAFCAHLSSLIDAPRVSPAGLEAELRAVISKGLTPLQVARGHDITGILAWAFVKRLGKKRSSGDLIDGDLIERSLRLAYSEASFAENDLSRRIKAWETRNSHYRVLR